jgi:dTDP-glucose 4,6-dehydratase/UDP-glucose 4-epimerase
MKALVTGGLGFIGSTLAHRLVSDGYSVVLVDSLIPQYGGNLFNIKGLEDKVTVNISDMRDPYSIRCLLKGVDVVFNLAGQTSHADSMTDPFTDLDINAKSQLSLLEAVRDVAPEVVVVFASTRQIYGRPHSLPVSESHPIRPVDVNGVNKVAGEQYHLLYHDVYGVRSVCLRLTNTYGPRMRIKDARQTFLGIWVNKLLSDDVIEVYGDGTQLRDFNYVDDVVDALIVASRTESCYGKALNLGGSEVISLSSLACLMCSLRSPNHGWHLVPFPVERKVIDIGDYYSDYKLAQELLSWHPQVSLSSGLERTLDYYEVHYAHYV